MAPIGGLMLSFFFNQRYLCVPGSCSWVNVYLMYCCILVMDKGGGAQTSHVRDVQGGNC